MTQLSDVLSVPQDLATDKPSPKVIKTEPKNNSVNTIEIPLVDL